LPSSSDLENDRLAGRIAVITGAAGAIGGATARLLAGRGATIVAVDHPDADWSRTKAALDAFPATLYVAADVTSEADVKAYARAAVQAFGRIDLFFNNAGIEGPQALLPDYPVAEFRRILEVNVTGVFLGLQAVLPVMIGQKGGAIVNSSSIAGLIGATGMAGYIASKHAVLGLTRVAALEGAEAGVRVNSVHPGFIESRMLSDIASRLGGTSEALATMVPVKRLGTPDEIAKGVAFLLSDESSYMNGGQLVLDGGLTVG